MAAVWIAEQTKSILEPEHAPNGFVYFDDQYAPRRNFGGKRMQVDLAHHVDVDAGVHRNATRLHAVRGDAVSYEAISAFSMRSLPAM